MSVVEERVKEILAWYKSARGEDVNCYDVLEKLLLDAVHNDRLSKEFEQQREFMKLLRAKRDFPVFPLNLSQKSSQVFCKHIAYDMMGEVFEAIQELKNSKLHRATNIDDLDQSKLLEELVDAKHFLNELFILLGFSEEDVHKAYMEKGYTNLKRIIDGY